MNSAFSAGPAGSHVLALLRELQMPIVTTLHTVLREPNAEQRRVMRDLIRHSTRLVVMSERSREFLRDVYQTPAAKIDFIPHGIPDMPFDEPNEFGDKFTAGKNQLLALYAGLLPSKDQHDQNAGTRMPGFSVVLTSF